MDFLRAVIKKYLRRETDLVGLNIQGSLCVKKSKTKKIAQKDLLGISTSLVEYVFKHNIKEVVIVADEKQHDLPYDELFDLQKMGIRITDVLDFIERETGQVAVDHLTPSWFLYQKKSDNKVKNFIY